MFVNFTGRECSYLWINLSPHWGDPDLYIASAALYHDDIAKAPYNFNRFTFGFFLSSFSFVYSWGEIWGNEDWIYCPSTPTFESGTQIFLFFCFLTILFIYYRHVRGRSFLFRLAAIRHRSRFEIHP